MTDKIVQATPQPAPAPPPSPAQTAKRIPLRLSGNSYIVPVLINGSIWLDFTIDTGASDVSIPADVGMTLMRTGTITKEDIGREQTYNLANGGTVKNTQFRIHSLQVGKGDNAVVAHNVGGSIGGPQGSLLLGQSFLRLFRSTTIDHENRMLIIDGSESQPPVQTGLQPAPAPPPVLQPAPAPVLQPPASAQQGPIPPPSVPQYRCANPPPETLAMAAAWGRFAGSYLNGWRGTCMANYNMAMQRWRAEMERVEMLNRQRGY